MRGDYERFCFGLVLGGFFSKILQTRREWDNIFSILKEKKNPSKTKGKLRLCQINKRWGTLPLLDLSYEKCYVGSFQIEMRECGNIKPHENIFFKTLLEK
jgi:hypothetical protein